MYFDDSSRSPIKERKEYPQDNVLGIGIMVTAPDNGILEYSFVLTKGCPNNTIEYEAVISGLKLALIPYHSRPAKLLAWFEEI